MTFTQLRSAVSRTLKPRADIGELDEQHQQGADPGQGRCEVSKSDTPRTDAAILAEQTYLLDGFSATGPKPPCIDDVARQFERDLAQAREIIKECLRLQPASRLGCCCLDCQSVRKAEAFIERTAT